MTQLRLRDAEAEWFPALEEESTLGYVLRWLDQRFSTNEDPAAWQHGAYDPPNPFWETGYAITPLDWTVGASISHEPGHHPIWPSRVDMSINLGPLHLYAYRQWGGRP